MNVSFQNATFVVSFSDDYDDDEMIGTGGWVDINRKQLAELYADYQWNIYNADPESLEWDVEEHDETETTTIPDSDDFIVFANAAGIEGGTYEITFAGNPYWFFHDLSHAEHDAGGGNVNIDSDGWAERRALYDGAVSALEHGVKPSDIIRQLVKVEPEYEERFGQTTDILDRFLWQLDGKLSHSA